MARRSTITVSPERRARANATRAFRPRPAPKTASLQPKPKAKRPANAANSLMAQVEAAAALQYGGAEQQLAGQRAVNAQMQRNIPAWYADYQAALADATAKTQAAYGAATQQALNTAATAPQTSQLQGVGQQTAAADAQAGASRQQMLAQFANLVAGQGAAETAYGANRQRVGAAQRLTALEGEAQRARDTERSAQQLAREKGAFKVTTRQKLSDARHQRALEDAAFGLKTQEAQADQAAKAAALADRRRARVTANRNADESRRIAQQRADEQARANRAREARARTGSTADTNRRKKANRDAWGKIQTALADAKTLQHGQVSALGKDGKPETDAQGNATGRKRKLTPQEVRDQVRRRYRDADIADAAYDIAYRGTISGPVAARLRARGIAIPSRWLGGTLRPTLSTHPR